MAKKLAMFRELRPLTAAIWGLSITTLLFLRDACALPTPVVSYLFTDTLAAEEAGSPALSAVDPLGLSTFETAPVFGQTRRVYRFDGNASPVNQQAGLSLDTTGLVASDTYSVELVFEFLEETGTYRRILDVQDRASTLVSTSTVLIN